MKSYSQVLRLGNQHISLGDTIQPTTPVLPSPTWSGPASHISHVLPSHTLGSHHTSCLLTYTCTMFNSPCTSSISAWIPPLSFAWLAPTHHSLSMSLLPKAPLWPTHVKCFRESHHATSVLCTTPATRILPDAFFYLLTACLPPLGCLFRVGRDSLCPIHSCGPVPRTVSGIRLSINIYWLKEWVNSLIYRWENQGAIKWSHEYFHSTRMWISL